MVHGARRLAGKYVKFLLAIAIPALLSPLALSSDKAARCGYVLLLMAAYWILEVVPMAVTSLLPIALFPLMGIMSTAQVTPYYMKDTVMMFFTSLIFAIAMEHSKLHRRIALKVLVSIGSSFEWMATGLMATTAFLSMWITNTAATAVMLPIGAEILRELAHDSVHVPGAHRRRELILTLGIAYCANVGGMGTLTGTSPNLILSGLVEELFKVPTGLTYGSWMAYNVPCVLLCVIAIRLFLHVFYFGFRSFKSKHKSSSNIQNVLRQQYEDLGSLSFHEAAVLVLFVALVMLWLSREPRFVPGWSDLMSGEVRIRDATPAVLLCLPLFFIPARPLDLSSREPLLDWGTAQSKLPWWLFLLVGGGFALAEGSKVSGLSHWISLMVQQLSPLPAPALAALACVLTATITEVVSNPMAATLLLPVAASLAQNSGVHPLYLMVPVATSCSFAFMLPIATAPNAMAYESARLSVWDMIKPGIFLNLICCAIEIGMINSLGIFVFDLHSSSNITLQQAL